MNKYLTLLTDEKFIINSSLVRALDKNMSLNEFLILVYLDNHKNSSLNVDEIKKLFNINEEDILEAFSNLTMHNLVSITTSTDQEGRINESISLQNLYEKVLTSLNEAETKKEQADIFETFETEFGRPLSPSEFELINGWLKTGTPEALIKGALKEAIYNGVRNFRYIDKIIYEWQKKGFKSMDDVNKHLRNEDKSLPKDKKEKTQEEELFDYNWLDDDE